MNSNVMGGSEFRINDCDSSDEGAGMGDYENQTLSTEVAQVDKNDRPLLATKMTLKRNLSIYSEERRIMLDNLKA